MVLLLDCLKRRENWPQQFIDALEACEHTTLAADMRAEYDALRGVSSKSLSRVPFTLNENLPRWLRGGAWLCLSRPGESCCLASIISEMEGII